MKKIVIAALLSAVSGAALANVPGEAEIVFQGASAAVTPGASVAITGEGGAELATGELTVNVNGSFVTNAPVKFEIRDVNDAGVVGGVSTSENLQMRYSTVELIAGETLGVVTNPKVTVALTNGGDIGSDFGKVTSRNGLSVSHKDPITGYVSGETVKTTVALLVTNGPTPPTTPEGGAEG